MGSHIHAYVHEFTSANKAHLGCDQVKLLVILVESLVTTGFSTIFGWVLIPIVCLVDESSNSISLSQYIRGVCIRVSLPAYLCT
jgi:hypothetical protein